MLFRCPIICKTLVLVLTPLCDNQVLAVNLLVRNTHRRLDSFLEVGMVYLCEGLRAVPNGVSRGGNRDRGPTPTDGSLALYLCAVIYLLVEVSLLVRNIFLDLD